MSSHKAIVVITGRAQCFHDCIYIMPILLWARCVSWITYDHLYYAPCSACWALLGLLVPAMCNLTSCAQAHELPQSHCGDNREGTMFSWLHIYYVHLVTVRFDIYITTYLYLYLSLYPSIYISMYIYLYLSIYLSICLSI